MVLKEGAFVSLSFFPSTPDCDAPASARAPLMRHVCLACVGVLGSLHESALQGTDRFCTLFNQLSGKKEQLRCECPTPAAPPFLTLAHSPQLPTHSAAQHG